MNSTVRRLAAMTLGLPALAAAQSIPGAVLAKNEPHHHLAYEDSVIRVLRVRVAPHDTTLLHEHDPDYFWIAIGSTEVVNAVLGKPDAMIKAADLSVHYTPGKFAHVARNPGESNFDNITVELLGAQTNVRNLCEMAVAGKPLDCANADEMRAGSKAVREHPAFETDQLRVSVVMIQPGGILGSRGDAEHVRVIALDTSDTGRALRIGSGGRWVGGTFNAPRGAWSITNGGTHAARALLVAHRRQ